MTNTRNPIDFLITIAARFGGKAANLVVFAIVANNLSLTEIGIYGYIFTTLLIASTLLDLGTRNSLATSIGREPESANFYTRIAYQLLIPLSLLALPIAASILLLGPESNVAYQLMAPSALMLIFMLHQRMLLGAVLGRGQIKLFNTVELTSRLALIALTLGMLATNTFSLMSAIWSLTASQALGSVYLALKQRHDLAAETRLDKGNLTKSLLISGLPFMLAVVLMQVSKKLAFYVVAYSTDSAAAGLFFGLQRLTEVVTEVGLAISVVLLSHNVRSTSAQDAASNTATSVRISVAVFIIISTAMVTTSSYFVPVLLGRGFGGHELLFAVLVLGTLFGSVWTMLFPSLCVAVGSTTALKVLAASLPANILVTAVASWYWGLTGAAWSTILINALISWAFLRSYTLKFDIPMRAFLVVKASDFPIEKVQAKLLRTIKRTGKKEDD